MRRPFINLTLDERRVIAWMLQAKVPKTKIAQMLGRSRPTVTREGLNPARRASSSMRRSISMSFLPKASQRSWPASCPSGAGSGNRAMAAHPATGSRANEHPHRPPGINDRSPFGNREGDLMIFGRAQDEANVATLIERKTRYTVLLRNDDRNSWPLMNRLIPAISPLPAEARRSITFDRGLEFVAWRELESGMGTKAWFCGPQAPWQKGSVENMNRRLRRYLPRDTAVLPLAPRSRKMLCQRLNATPRKGLGYRTPGKAFRKELIRLEAP